MGEKHISEDYIFLSIIDQASWIFQETLGRRGRVIGDFVEVRHLLKRNLGENLPKETRGEVLGNYHESDPRQNSGNRNQVSCL